MRAWPVTTGEGLSRRRKGRSMAALELDGAATRTDRAPKARTGAGLLRRTSELPREGVSPAGGLRPTEGTEGVGGPWGARNYLD